jgi:CheY-like chemotaxis protein
MTRILVVDDAQDIASVIKQALEKGGFAVDAFTSPEEALDKFKPNYYSMLITDIRMPVMNGFQLYRQIRKMDSKIKVAFMTAFEINDDEFGKVLPSIDVKLFFKKPVHINDLVEKVKQQLSEDITMS